MWNTERKEGADISEPSLCCLSRQAVDEVKAEVINSLTAEIFDSGEYLLCRVTAIEEGEIVSMEALHPHTYAVDGECPQSLGVVRCDVIGVAFDSHFA